MKLLQRCNTFQMFHVLRKPRDRGADLFLSLLFQFVFRRAGSHKLY